jgi:hypothetical protein
VSDTSDLRRLSQTFPFDGAAVDDVARVLAEEPLVGPRSVFGDKKAKTAGAAGAVRRIEGFEPAPVPLLRFDVELRQEPTDDGVRVLVEFSQPGRKRPYLVGQFVWLLSAGGNGAVLDEEINTPTALEIVDRPLHGHRFSVRRWLFFAGGHKRLMTEATANIRALLHG